MMFSSDLLSGNSSPGLAGVLTAFSMGSRTSDITSTIKLGEKESAKWKETNASMN
jgi:hypothetical protein